jgi:histidinol dehydrogenase
MPRDDEFERRGRALVLRLNYRQPDFETRFAAFLTTKREVSEDVEADVRAIIKQVRARGDEALHDFSHRVSTISTPAAWPCRRR